MTTARLGNIIRWAVLAGLPLSLAAAAPAPAWIGAWASAQMQPEARNALPGADLTDSTLRQTIRVTADGRRIRIRLSNLAGTAPLTIDSVHVARAATPGTAANRSGTDRAVRFEGAEAVTIPAGADYWSDPVALPVAALDSLNVSFHLLAAPDRQTGHSASHATSFVVPGNHAADGDLPGAKPFEHWVHLSGVAVEGGKARGAIVALGDSITDGSGSTANASNRWPDVLAERLRGDARTRGLAVLNAGIGGNRVLLDGAGPNTLSRFDRDVLAQPGVRFLILLEGINDIGTLTREGPVSAVAHADLVRRLTAGYAQIVARAHQHGIKVIVATLPPFMGALSYHPDAANEADRQAVNAWIRAPGHADGVIDFDRATRDPEHPDRLLPRFDSGDHLHPSPQGYHAMGMVIPLALFE
ncbi:MAG: SGNH/GDSL hydrolase family protein [Sphingomonas sp.]